MQSLIKIPYQIILNAFRLISPRGANIWARNSYALNTLVPFKSDLDVTLWFESLTEEDLKPHSYVNLANRFKIIKEMNLYLAPEAVRFQKQANFFELQRDPHLLRKLTDINKEDINIQAAVFLLRMLEFDYHNIIDRPHLRIKKWSQHLELVDWSQKPRAEELFDQILEAIASLLSRNKREQSEIKNQICLYLAHRIENPQLEYYQQTKLLHENPWWVGLFPHAFCFNKNPVLINNQIFYKTLRYQIAWELWGLLTQMRFINDKSQTLNHLNDLIYYIILIDDSDLLKMAKYLQHFNK